MNQPLLNADEEDAMQHITNAVLAIKQLGLVANEEELAAAAHVIGGFVIRHMLQRLEHQYWSLWFKDIP